MDKKPHHQNELELLPPPPPTTAAAATYAFPWFPPKSTTKHTKAQAPTFDHHHGKSPLDLQLSISLRPVGPIMRPGDPGPCIRALKWQAAEQIRLAAMEKAYAERVRELSRREIELAQAEFARARVIWERAKEDVAMAEKLRENAIRRIESSSSSSSSSCFEITCHSCRQRFRP
ncbi:hypothetical protein Droror1_Dr00021452 [Drosera rotundifolia]